MGDETPPYILLGLVALLCLGTFLIFFLGRRRSTKVIQEKGVPVDAQVVSVHRAPRSVNGVEKDFPDFQLWVRYGSEDESHMAWIQMTYWTVRANFPELLKLKSAEAEGFEGRIDVSVPVLMDPDRPDSVSVDYAKVEKKRGGFAKYSEA